MSLSAREKKMVLGAGLFLAVMLPVYLIFFPAMDRLKHLKSQLATETLALEKIQNLAARHALFSARSDSRLKAAQTRPKSFTLFSHIDHMARMTGVKDHIGYMKPGTRALEHSPHHLASVKLKLKGVFFNDLVAFVSGIESRETGVEIVSITLSKIGKKESPQTVLLDAVMDIQALIPGGEKG
jgi:hypothetical protein